MDRIAEVIIAEASRNTRARQHFPDDHGRPRCEWRGRSEIDWLTVPVSELDNLLICQKCMKQESQREGFECPFCGESIQMLPAHVPTCPERNGATAAADKA